MIFDQKNEGFLSSCFTTDEEIFVVLNPSVKQCFPILLLMSIMDWKVEANNIEKCSPQPFNNGRITTMYYGIEQIWYNSKY